ncbi:hypothetical protein CTAYLR_002981 [Chrysophaeum taylorii]|uniref:XPA C-terminal domain-containing protein n=1 Tax=Chrysophaeum taylorii TaxID=2483200 RepID=A0AAD7U4T7_9STRA|nr:hypothetical protein CTAYLR_002981 [Chrysophaeum taylorii]
MCLSAAQKARIEANRLEALRRRREGARASPPKRQRGMCAECGGPADPSLASFEIFVCAKHRSEKLDLITATEAAQEYLLPKATLAELRSVARKNPRGFATPMKLYLRLDLEEAAKNRFGSLDHLEAERHKRHKAAYGRQERRAATFFRTPSS